LGVVTTHLNLGPGHFAAIDSPEIAIGFRLRRWYLFITDGKSDPRPPGFDASGSTQSHPPGPFSKEAVMTTCASGTFEVKLVPQVSDDRLEDATLGRMTIDKQFHGELEATSRGQMLSAMTNVKGSAGYVAIERVGGTLHGRRGTFALQHSGTMTRGVPQLSVTVVPDSGTDQLVGLSGKLTIIVADGKHSYEFEYTLDETP